MAIPLFFYSWIWNRLCWAESSGLLMPQRQFGNDIPEPSLWSVLWQSVGGLFDFSRSTLSSHSSAGSPAFYLSLSIFIFFFLILEAMACSPAQKLHAAVFSLLVIRSFCLWPHYDKSPSCLLRRHQLARWAQTTTAGKHTQRTRPHVLHQFFFFKCNLMLFF